MAFRSDLYMGKVPSSVYRCWLVSHTGTLQIVPALMSWVMSLFILFFCAMICPKINAKILYTIYTITMARCVGVKQTCYPLIRRTNDELVMQFGLKMINFSTSKNDIGSIQHTIIWIHNKATSSTHIITGSAHYYTYCPLGPLEPSPLRLIVEICLCLLM